MRFEDAQWSFYEAARAGLGARLAWLDGERVEARELLLERLLPLARSGLVELGVSPAEAAASLRILEERVASGQTGAEWVLKSFEAMPSRLSAQERCWRITDALRHRCWEGLPVHRWPVEGRRPSPAAPPPLTVVMRHDFPALPAHAPIALAEQILVWRRCSELVVEEDDGAWVGVITLEALRQARMAGAEPGTRIDGLARQKRPLVIASTLTVLEALRHLRREGAASALVVSNGRVAGLVYREDLLGLLPAGLRSKHDEPLCEQSPDGTAP
jgi:CBS domain-containing protein